MNYDDWERCPTAFAFQWMSNLVEKMKSVFDMNGDKTEPYSS